MLRSMIRRSLLAVALLSGVVPAIVACATPQQAPPQAEPPPPLPMLGSIAAHGIVEDVSVASRQVVVRMASGALLDVSPGPDFGVMSRLRPGLRLVVEYDARGTVRLGFPPSSGAPPSGRIPGTIEDVMQGGREVSITDQQGVTVTFEVPDRAMMAFLTRLRPGDDVAVTVLGPR
jgi:hypothetical protein